MYIVTVEFSVKESYVQEFLTAVNRNAVISRSEPGCSQFDVAVSVDAMNNIFLYEIYLDENSFDKHTRTEHFRMFDDLIREMVETKRVKFFRDARA